MNAALGFVIGLLQTVISLVGLGNTTSPSVLPSPQGTIQVPHVIVPSATTTSSQTSQSNVSATTSFPSKHTRATGNPIQGDQSGTQVINELITASKPFSCTFSASVQIGKSPPVTTQYELYVGNGMSAITGSTNISKTLNMTTDETDRDAFRYLWTVTDATGQETSFGHKIKIIPGSNPLQSYIDSFAHSQITNLRCRSWVLDMSVFAIPSNIDFPNDSGSYEACTKGVGSIDKDKNDFANISLANPVLAGSATNSPTVQVYIWTNQDPNFKPYLSNDIAVSHGRWSATIPTSTLQEAMNAEAWLTFDLRDSCGNQIDDVIGDATGKYTIVPLR